ncbi:RluA family pseudouridine synthase [Rapidithrix thailandica]|uniref:Pseudouridine synthase n=1 Tax=Rapidithrix thailandica TaxID=413964 RepID=A0AAW9S3U4_9BACT
MEEFDEELYEEQILVVDAGQSLLRIDKYLQDKLQGVSRNKIQDAITDGLVLVNSAVVKPNYKVKPEDKVTIYQPKGRGEIEIVPQGIPLEVIYEDASLLVLNKEAGMVVHPGHGNWDGTLVNALTHRFQHLPTSRNGEMKPGLVHRIDKDTSGLLVIAKTDKAMTHLAQQFFEHTIERTYWALVWGEVKEDEGTVEGNIGRSPQDRRVSMVYPEGDYGKPAITHYKVIKRLRYVTLVQCNLETGRTHQIRVHMKHIGHPLFGDVMYGGNKILKGEKFSKYKSFVENCFKILPRQALHAKSLGFVHPDTNEQKFFESELPEDFTQVLERWENYLNYH